MSTRKGASHAEAGAKGGRVGGRKRALALTSERRREIARAAALAGWRKRDPCAMRTQRAAHSILAGGSVRRLCTSCLEHWETGRNRSS